VVLASETAMRQLLARKLPFERAPAHGLIAIDAAGESELQLQSGWSAAFPKIGLGSFDLSAAAPLQQ
jgi:hypothetical protein